ncbi:MAG: hypothetical protein ACE5WD_07205 [Candidatus Aminicenantia bacterium]
MGKKGIVLSAFLLFQMSFFTLSPIYSTEKDTPLNITSAELSLNNYRIFPVKKPQFDYISTLSANSKSLGLKQTEDKALLAQSNTKWAIRAYQRHILDSRKYNFLLNQSLPVRKELKNTQAKVKFLVVPYILSPNTPSSNWQVFGTKGTNLSLFGEIDSNTKWKFFSQFWQSGLAFGFNNVSTTNWNAYGDVILKNINNHFFRFALGIEERYANPRLNLMKNRSLWTGSILISDHWTISSIFSLSCGIKYDYLQWSTPLNLISPDITISLYFSESIQISGGFSYDWSTPGEISFINPEELNYLPVSLPSNLAPESSFKYFLNFEKSFGPQSLINIKAYYEKINNQLFKMPYTILGNTNQLEFIYFIYNLGEAEDKGIDITLSQGIGSIIEGSISYGFIYSEYNQNLISLPQIIPEEFLKTRAIHIFSSLIKAKLPITNTLVLVSYNWTSAIPLRGKYSFPCSKSRLKIKQELPFLSLPNGKIQVLIDFINFLDDNDLLQNNEWIVLIPYPKKIAGGIEIKF